MIHQTPIVAALQKVGINYMEAPPLNVARGFGILSGMNARLNNNLFWQRDFIGRITIYCAETQELTSFILGTSVG